MRGGQLGMGHQFLEGLRLLPTRPSPASGDGVPAGGQAGPVVPHPPREALMRICPAGRAAISGSQQVEGGIPFTKIGDMEADDVGIQAVW